MYDLLIRTLSALEQWLSGQSSSSVQVERSSRPEAARAKALEYDHYIRLNVGTKESR